MLWEIHREMCEYPLEPNPHPAGVSARQKESPGLEGKQQEGSSAGAQLLMHLFWLNFAVNWQPQSGAWQIPGTAPVLPKQR